MLARKSIAQTRSGSIFVASNTVGRSWKNRDLVRETVASAQFCLLFTKWLADDSGTYTASISPRVTARPESALLLYPCTMWQSSFSASQVKAAPIPKPDVPPAEAHRHFI